MHSGMMEKFDLLMQAWEVRKKDQKEEGLAMKNSTIPMTASGLSQLSSGDNPYSRGTSGGEGRIEP